MYQRFRISFHGEFLRGFIVFDGIPTHFIPLSFAQFSCYDHLSAYIHQYYICNVGGGSDSNRELQYEIQFLKVSTTRQFVSESLKYNIIRSLKQKYYSSKEKPSASNSLKTSKTSDNVKYISLLSKPYADESCVERFLKAIRNGPVYFRVVCNRCFYKSNVVLFDKKSAP